MLRLKHSLLMNEDFAALLRKISAYKIPVSAGLKLLRLCERLDEERRILISARDNLIMNYGKDDGTGYVSVPTSDPEIMREFGPQYNQLMNEEFETSLPGKILLNTQVKDKDGAELCLSLAELTLLTQIIEFEGNSVPADDRPPA